MHYTNELLSTRRFQEFHPILEQTLHVIEDLQTEFPSTEVWNGLEIQFVRFLQNNRAHHPQAQRITSSDREVNELRIDIKHKAYGESPQEIGEKIKHELQTHIEGEPDDDIIYLDRPDTRLPFLETAGQSGWSRFGDVPIAEGIPDLGAAAAENPEVIEFSAQKIFESLKTAPHMDEYVIMESGIWNANGIPEMIARLAELVEAEDDQVLHQKLQRIQIVGIDIAEEGVESFNTRLTQEIEINPLLKKHR